MTMEKKVNKAAVSKKRKQRENNNKDVLEFGANSKQMKYDWTQTAASLTIELLIGDDINNISFDVQCSDQECSVKLTDGRTWHCIFYQPVISGNRQSHCNGNKFVITFMKSENLEWPHLEEMIKEDSVTTKNKEPEHVIDINNCKYDWYEKDQTVNVQLYVKGIIKDSLDISFQEKSFIANFKTNDFKFRSQYEQSSEETVFHWCINLREDIIPGECRFVVNSTKLDINVKKKVTQKWAALKAVPSMSQSNNIVQLNEQNNSTLIPPKIPPPPPPYPEDKLKKTNHLNNKNNSSLNNAPFIQQSADQKKQTCAVSPVAKRPVFPLGNTGLENLGNTCFLNSVIQCLVNTREFRDYFLESRFQPEINMENPLGFGGKLAVEFAVLCKILWSGNYSSYPPSKLKNLLAMKASQFTGFAQHDAQEFMAFLLDGLHEDLNRIVNKPLTSSVESDGRADQVVAEESWQQYKLRNDSIVVDLFQGQYKSKLTCPDCKKVSITFDPFLYLSVPLPKRKRLLPIIFFSRHPYQRPVKYLVQLPEDAIIADLLKYVSTRTDVPAQDMRVFEVLRSKFHRFFSKANEISAIQSSDLIFVFEVLSEALAGENVIHVPVMQRVVMTPAAVKCAFCKRDCSSGETRLKRCMRCYRVSYCDQACQKNHWSFHKASCKVMPEAVGCPFIISIPQSQATYSRVVNMMEAFSRYSVDVFQPPVKPSESFCPGVIGDRQFPDLPTSPASQTSELSISKLSLNETTEEQAENTNAEQKAINVDLSGELRSPDTPLPGLITPTLTDKPWSFVRPLMTNEAGERTLPPFHIQPIDKDGNNLIGDLGASIKDNDEDIIDFTSKRFLAMDWRNNEKTKSYVLVQSKELEFDIDELGANAYRNDVRHTSLTECLQLFTEPETLTKEEAWYCPQCKQHREATKQMSIWKLPTVLIIQLKRFGFSQYIWRDKIDKMIDFPIEGLDLSAYCCGNNQGFTPTYDLYGVINHHGMILGGHYMAASRLLAATGNNETDMDWRLFDDSVVTHITKGSVVTKSAYVLFYRLRGSPFTLPGVTPKCNTNLRQDEEERQMTHVDSNIITYPELSKEEKNNSNIRLSTSTDLDAVD